MNLPKANVLDCNPVEPLERFVCSYRKCLPNDFPNLYNENSEFAP
jgi:hypothetical protein